MKKFSEFKKTLNKKLDNQEKQQGDYNLDYNTQVNKNVLAQEEIAKDVVIPEPVVSTKQHVVHNTDPLLPKKTDESVNVIGKVAQFPKNTKASKAYDYLNNLKDPKLAKNNIWYILVEKQGFDDNGNELQMVRYDKKRGVNLIKFVSDLKDYYINKYSDNATLVESIEKIELSGDKDGLYTTIKNIPNYTFENKKLVSRITEDLIKLLAK